MTADKRILMICFAVNIATIALPCRNAVAWSAEEGPMNAFKAADVVFAGYLTEVCTRLDEQKDWPRSQLSTQTWTFKVFAIWKGNVEERADIVVIRIWSPFEYGWEPFQLGNSYLVYATRTNGTLSSQHRTTAFSQALVDRYLLPKPSKVTAPSEFHEVTLDSLIQTVIDGSGDPMTIIDFKWLRKDADRIVPVMTSVLRSQRAGDTDVAMRVLGLLGPPSSVAIPDLERVTTDPSERRRESALRALDSIETDQTQRLRRLIEALHDPSPRLRLMVVELLANFIGDIALNAETKSLISRLRIIGESDPDARVRDKIELALESVNDKR